MSRNKVLVAGSYIQDLFFKVDEFPVEGETKLGYFSTGPGGKGSNQAIASLRSGTETALAVSIAEDHFGKYAEEFWEKEGLKTFTSLRLDPRSNDQPKTGTASIIINKYGQNNIVVSIGANNCLFGGDILTALAEFNPNILVLQLESNLEGIQNVVYKIKEQDLNFGIILNPAPMNKSVAPELFSSADVITPNETEFIEILKILGTDHVPHFAELPYLPESEFNKYCRKIGTKTVIVTLGEEGCFVSTENNYYYVKAPKVNVVSTAGAGDCFTGVFSATLSNYLDIDGILSLNEENIEKSVKRAVVASSLSVTKEGTAPSMPHKDEIEAAMKVLN